MESLRRPSVLAAIAVAVLIINGIVLVVLGDDSDVPGQDASVAGPGDDAAESDDQDTGGEGTEDAAGDGDAPEESDGEQAGDADAAGGGDDGEPGDGAGLGVPTAGTYQYDSAGGWTLSGSGDPEEYELPSTAAATVEVDGDSWQARLAAGDGYADRFGYVTGPDGGLDWTSWVLERRFSSGMNETPYECSGDSAYYRPDESGRVVQHDCESPAGITSEGQVEHVGSEELTLGDGTVVVADRLRYAYTVSGSGGSDGSEFEASGEGRLELWLDPDTGMRLREQRSIATTTTFSTGAESHYREDVEFTLQSLQPA